MNEFFAREIAPPKLPITYASRDLPAVVRLQEWLVVRGYKVWRNDVNAPGIDGDYGDGTHAGVLAFAKAHELAPVVDSMFWGKLTEPMRAAASYTPTAPSLGAAAAEVAEVYLAARPREARFQLPFGLRGLDNSGPWVRSCMAPFASWPAPWCMGFMRPLLIQAANATKVNLPFAIDGPGVLPLYVPSIVAQARKRGRFVEGVSRTSVGPGSLMFLRGIVNGSPSHTHVGMVVKDNGDTVTTIEGNTNNDGSSNGWLVLKMVRRRNGIDFGAI
jgi:hypothetical protein